MNASVLVTDSPDVPKSTSKTIVAFVSISPSSSFWMVMIPPASAEIVISFTCDISLPFISAYVHCTQSTVAISTLFLYASVGLNETC